MRFVMGVLAFAAVHFVGSYFVVFAAGVGGGARSPLGILATILTFPLSVLSAPDTMPMFAGWLAWALLSLAWGVGLLYLARWLFNTRR